MTNREKLHEAIDKMIDANGGDPKRVVYYHTTATFIETKYGKFMLRLTGYTPPKVGLDEFEKSIPM